MTALAYELERLSFIIFQPEFREYRPKEPTVEEIIEVVAHYFELPSEVLHMKTRKREIVQARQIAMYLSKEKTKLSLSEIGRLIGNKDHATVLHAKRTVSNLCDTDKRFKADVNKIEKKFA